MSDGVRISNAQKPSFKKLLREPERMKAGV